MVGMNVAHTWRGHGSAIFLEFGSLTPRTGREGSPGNPNGTFGAMIEWHWRIEGQTEIICGSSSDDAVLEAGLSALRGTTVTAVEICGQLPELAITLSNGCRVLSFMTCEGDPQWTLFDRRSSATRWLRVRGGRLTEESGASAADQ
jgi:hypothetical protein